ncbi:MAG: hypothetical protein JXX14_24900 [Deltaproteobacteria bacterium]|nr:hypothetical protein [Deltaproteobacteria bacterium]
MTPQLQTIIPLAGPDFILPDGSLKPLYPVDGEPLIMRALQSRPWYEKSIKNSENVVFVLRDTSQTPRFKQFLRGHFPNCRIVTSSHLTRGALLSAAAGVAVLNHPEWPVCIDLVDIIYKIDTDVERILSDDDCAGVLPWFESDNPMYSYLVIDDDNVTQTAEKKVISHHASAGTYFFKDMTTYFHAVSESMQHAEDWTYNNVFFLCPAYNSLTSGRGKIKAVQVTDVIPVSKMFHK